VNALLWLEPLIYVFGSGEPAFTPFRLKIGSTCARRQIEPVIVSIRIQRMITILAILLAVFSDRQARIFLTSAYSAGSEAVQSSSKTSGQLFDHGSVAKNNPDLSHCQRKSAGSRSGAGNSMMADRIAFKE